MELKINKYGECIDLAEYLTDINRDSIDTIDYKTKLQAGRLFGLKPIESDELRKLKQKLNDLFK